MLVKYTIEVNNDHIQVGNTDDGRTMAVSVKTGVKATHINPLNAIAQVIGTLTPAACRTLLREVADRV